MASKLKCTVCKEFFPKEEVIRTGVTSVCSDRCLRNSYHKKKKRKKKKARKPGKTRARSLDSNLRKKVFERDGNSCRVCGTNQNLHAHHIRYRSQGGEDLEQNLICVCLECHQLVHSDKKKWQPMLLGYIWRRYCEGKLTQVH